MLLNCMPCGAQDMQLTEKWRIGAITSPGYDLSDIAAVAIDGYGRVYVGQNRARSIHVFGSDGTFQRRVGRAGYGPGELQSIHTLLARGRFLHVYDRSRQVLVVYDTTGGHQRQWGRNYVGSHISQDIRGPMGILADSSLVYEGREEGKGRLTVVAVHPARGARQLAALRVQSDGVLMKLGNLTIGVPQLVRWSDQWQIAQDGRSIVVTALGESPTSGSTKSRSRFSVHRIDMDGDTTFSRAFSYTVRPLDGSEKARLVAERFQQIREIADAFGANPRDFEKEYLALAANDLFRPPVDALVLSNDGSLWLREYGVRTGTTTWLALDPSGRFHRRISAPADWTLKAANGGDLYFATETSAGIPQLVKAVVRDSR